MLKIKVQLKIFLWSDKSDRSMVAPRAPNRSLGNGQFSVYRLFYQNSASNYEMAENAWLHWIWTVRTRSLEIAEKSAKFHLLAVNMLPRNTYSHAFMVQGHPNNMAQIYSTVSEFHFLHTYEANSVLVLYWPFYWGYLVFKAVQLNPKQILSNKN